MNFTLVLQNAYNICEFNTCWQTILNNQHIGWLGGTTGSASDQQSTNNREVVGSRPTKVVCITVLTGNRWGWTVRCGRPPLLLPSCKKLEFRLSALMDSDLALVNGKSGRQSWRYADAFQRSIISEAIYHFTDYYRDNLPSQSLDCCKTPRLLTWLTLTTLNNQEQHKQTNCQCISWS